MIIECAAVYDREEHEIEVEAFAEAVIGYLKNKGVDLADPDWALGAPRRPIRRTHRADAGAMMLASDAARASRSLPPSLSGDESIPFSSQHVAVRTLYNYPPYADLKATIAEELLAHLPPPAPPPPPTRITPVAEQMLLEEEAAAAEGDGGDGIDAAAEFGDGEEGAFATAPSSDFSGGGAFADFA